MIPERNGAPGLLCSWGGLPCPLDAQGVGHEEFAQFRGNCTISTLSDRKGWAMMAPRLAGYRSSMEPHLRVLGVPRAGWARRAST